MDYDDAKDEAMALLTAVLDKASAIVRTAFLGHGFATRLKSVDYAAQVIVFNFPDMQPNSDLVDVIGAELRTVWPDAPAITATFVKVSSMNSDLILDFNRPSGIKALAEAGDVQALFAITGGSALSTVHYTLDRFGQKREAGMMTVHERSL